MCFSDGAVKSKGKKCAHFAWLCYNNMLMLFFWQSGFFCCLLLRMVISPHFPKHTSMNNYKVSMMAHLKIIMCSSKQEQQQSTRNKNNMLITFCFKKSVNVWHGKWYGMTSKEIDEESALSTNV